MRMQTTLCSPIGPSQSGTLFIERDTFDEVINYAQAADKFEICGYLLVKRLGPMAFTVLENSLHIPLQLAGIGASETLPEGEAAQMDREDDTDDDTYRLLWHSHVNGQAGFSSTDLDTHASFGRTTMFDAVFFMVVNQHGDASANLELYRPFRLGTQLRLVVLEPYEETDLTPYKAIIKQFCLPYPPKKPRPFVRVINSTAASIMEEGLE